MKKLKNARSFLRRPNLRLWLITVGTATLLLGAAYGMVQQATRQSANDLPRHTGEALRSIINNNKSANSYLQSYLYSVDLSKDSSVFIIITDKNKNVIASNAQLNGNAKLLPPAGVLAYAKAHGSDSVTWQPKAGVRLASYTTTYTSGGYIVTGQSLKPYEDRENDYLLIAAIAWVAVVIWVTLLILI